MKQVDEAFSLGVDPDKIQGCVGREDWDGLEAAIAERKRARREETEAPKPVPETEDAARKELAALQKSIDEQVTLLNESTDKLRSLLP